MDQVAQAKVQFRREQWKKIIMECQESGITPTTYYNWIGRLRKKGITLPEFDENSIDFLILRKEQMPICLTMEEFAKLAPWDDEVQSLCKIN